MTGPSLAQVVADIVAVLPLDAVVKVGIEAAGPLSPPTSRSMAARVQPQMSATFPTSSGSVENWNDSAFHGFIP